MGRHWLLPLYDPLTRLLGVTRLHDVLTDQLDPRPGQRILEIGCGTGNLTRRVKARQPGAEVTGLDPDQAALTRARRKAARRGLTVRWDQGFAEQLPYADGAFDRVLSAFMFHHLSAEAKPAALREVRRALVPGGVLHVVDFDGATDSADGVAGHRGHIYRLVRGDFVSPDARGGASAEPRPRDHGERIPELMRDAGFAEVAEVSHRVHRLIGRVTYHRAVAPAAGDAG
jgi:ubiquinone/menaquinone biosynthesis C-methylase UbiE